MSVASVNKCPTAVALARYIEGGLSTRERAEIQAHLATCPACRETWYFAADTMPASRERRWRMFLPIAAMILLAVSLFGWWMLRQARSVPRSAALMSQLVDASTGYRFAQARISGFNWAPTDINRAAAGPSEAPLKVQGLAVELRQLAATSPDTATLHGSGIALLALGRPSEALDPLSRAASASDAPALYRFDYGAALLEAARRADDPAMTAQALHEIEVGLSRDPNDLDGLFNRGLALAQLGSAAAAIEAFEAYLQRDATSPWATEARSWIEELRKRASASRDRGIDTAMATFDAAALAWAEATLTGQAPPALDPAVTQARSIGPSHDQRLPQWQAAMSQANRWPAARVTCLARAIVDRARANDAYDLADHRAALDRATEYRASARCAGLPDADASGLMMLSRFGLNDPQALTDSNQILLNAERAGLYAIAGRIRMARGVAAGRRGDFGAGMAELTSALALCERAGERALCAMSEAMMAEQQWAVGSSEAVWISLRHALEQLPAVGSSRWTTAIVSTVVNVGSFAGWDGVALRFSAELDRTVGDRNPIARVSAAIRQARAWEALGAPGQATQALKSLDSSLERLPEPMRKAYENERDVIVARAMLVSDPQHAEGLLSHAAEFFAAARNETRRAEALLDRGRAYRRQGRTAEAIGDWFEGLTLVEHASRSIDRPAQRISQTDRVWDLYVELISAHLDQPATALDIVERGHAVGWPTRSDARVTASDGSWIPERTAIIVYSCLPDAVGRWVVSRRSLAFSLVTISQADLDAAVERYLTAMADSDGVAATRELADILWPANFDTRDVAHIIVVPDKGLGRLPLAAVMLEDRGRAGSVESVSRLPSLVAARDLLTLPRAQADAAPLAVLAAYGRAIPSARLDALPKVDSEIRDVGAVYGSSTMTLLGDDAALPKLMPAFERATVIHLAGHASVDRRFPERSQIYVSPRGGALTGAAISGLRLLRHPLVVLSACDTSAGRVYRGGGTQSLATAFLGAGARGVIASLWPVADGDTSRLMADLHHELKTHPPAAALRRVQQRARDEGMPARTWAAFEAVSAF